MADPVTVGYAVGTVAKWWSAISAGDSLTRAEERALARARREYGLRPVKGGFVDRDGRFVPTRTAVAMGARPAPVATPGVNPAAPAPASSASSASSELDRLLRLPTTRQAAAPRTESLFDKLIRGRTFTPRGGTVADRAPARYPTRTGAGYYQAEAYFSLGQWAQRELKRLLDRRRLRAQRKGPAQRPRSGGAPPQTPEPRETVPKIPELPERGRVAPTTAQQVLRRPGPAAVPAAPGAASRDRPAVDLPPVILQPGSVHLPRPAPIPRTVPRSQALLKTLAYALPVLPVLRSNLRATSSTRSSSSPGLVPGFEIRPELQALTATQGAGGNSRCQCKQPGRRRPQKPRCRNPVVRSRTFVKGARRYQTVTKELSCPVSSRRKPR